MLRGLLALATMVAVLGAPAAWSQSSDDDIRLEGIFAVATYGVSERTYALAGAVGALQVVDVTDPRSPAHISGVSGETAGFGGMGHIVDIEVVHGLDHVYAVAADYVAGSVWIVDVTDPRSPAYVSRISAETAGFGAMGSPTAVETLQTSAGPHLLVASAGDGALHIVDVGDMYSPTAASVIQASGLYALDDPRDVETFSVSEKTYAMVAAFGDDAVLILDVTNPDAPKWVARVDHALDGFTGLAGPEDVEVFGVFGKAYAFVAGGGTNAIQIMDVTDPRTPSPVSCISHGVYDLAVHAADIGVITKGVDLFVRTSPDAAVRLPSISGGLTSPTDCVWRDSTERDTMNHPSKMAVFESAGKAYLLATGLDGVHVIDITKPWDAKPLTAIRDGDGARLEDPYGLAAYQTSGGTYVAVASFGDDSLQILDMATPQAPSAVGSLVSTVLRNEPVWPADTAVFGTFGSAYVLASSARDDTIQTLDITDPADPAVLATVGNVPGFGDVEEPGAVHTYWDGERVYGLVAEKDSILVLDVTAPSSPGLVSAIQGAGGASILHVANMGGSPHLLAAYDGEVRVFDMGSPASPEHLSSLDVPPGISDVETFRISNITYASMLFRDAAVYLYDAVSAESLDAVAEQSRGLEYLWGFGGVETVAVFDRVLESPEADSTMLLASLGDPAAPHLLDISNVQNVGLEDPLDATVFESADRTYLAVVDHFDYEVTLLDITRPDTLGGITSQVADGRPGFDALAKPVNIHSIASGDGPYVLVAGADGRLQMLDYTTPWLPRSAYSLVRDLAAPQTEGPRDLEVFTLLDKTYLLSARTVYAPYGDAVAVWDVTMPEAPELAGGWSGR